MRSYHRKWRRMLFRFWILWLVMIDHRNLNFGFKTDEYTRENLRLLWNWLPGRLWDVWVALREESV